MSQKNYNYIINKARKRTIGENQNFMLAIVGQTGSGKSYTAMALAMMIDTSFTIDRINFRAQDFLKTTNQELDEGSVIMFDEAGIDVSSREWYTDRNKAINNVVETFRRDNLICIWTTPNFGNLDKKVRSYFHGLAVMMPPDKWGWGAIKYYDLYAKTQDVGVAPAYPLVKDGDHVVSLGSSDQPHRPNMYVCDPRKIDAELIEEYEKKKKEFTEEIKERGIESLEEESTKDLSENDIIGLLAHNPDKFDIHNDDLSDAEISRRIFSQLKVEYDDYEVEKNQIRDVVGYVRHKTEDAQEKSRDPFESFEQDYINQVPDEIIPAIRFLRNQGYNWKEISERLDIKYQVLYENGRRWEGNDWSILTDYDSQNQPEQPA